MDLASWVSDLTIVWFIVSGVTFTALLYVNAPYGRHMREGWGPSIPNTAAWMVMELPMVVLFGLWFVLGTHTDTITAWVFLGLWQAHYLHRVFIYPFTLQDSSKQMPLLIASLGFVTNIVCSTCNGYYLFEASGGYSARWLADPRFVLGAALFVAGYLINRQSDHLLRSLRTPGETGYRIPHGWLFRWVSCPNYLGEIIEWTGWAVATWSLPGLAFATWTAANLVPRALTTHRWYKRRFPEYPSERKALLPYLI